MRIFETVNEYDSVAPRHIRDALELLEAPTREAEAEDADTRHLAGAMYLVGYAVECALKAYLIVQYGKSDFGEVITELRTRGEPAFGGGYAHNLTLLWAASDLEFPEGGTMAAELAICAKWEPNWRYDPRIAPSRPAAEQFVAAAEAVYNWIEDRRQVPEGETSP